MAAAQQTSLVYSFFSGLGKLVPFLVSCTKKIGHFIKAAYESEAEEADSHQQNEAQGLCGCG